MATEYTDQTFPDNDSRQYPYYPPPQDSSSIPQSSNFGQPNYIPPDQYMYQGVNQNVYTSPFGFQILSEVKNLEDRLDHGGYQCYRIWLVCLSFFAVLELIFSVISFSFVWDPMGFFTGVIVSSWMIYQCACELEAIRERSQEKAYRALKLMVGYAIVNMLSITLGAIWYFHHYEKDHGTISAIFVFGLICTYLVFLVLHFGIIVLGAAKVHNVLRKRKTLLRELEGTGESV